MQGDDNLRTQDRGNGIHLFAVRDAEVRDNDIWHVRDGIYIEASNDSLIDNNRLRDTVLPTTARYAPELAMPSCKVAS